MSPSPVQPVACSMKEIVSAGSRKRAAVLSSVATFQIMTVRFQEGVLRIAASSAEQVIQDTRLSAYPRNSRSALLIRMSLGGSPDPSGRRLKGSFILSS